MKEYTVCVEKHKSGNTAGQCTSPKDYLTLCSEEAADAGPMSLPRRPREKEPHCVQVSLSLPLGDRTLEKEQRLDALFQHSNSLPLCRNINL